MGLYAIEVVLLFIGLKKESTNKISDISPIEFTKLNARWYTPLFNQPVRLPLMIFLKEEGEYLMNYSLSAQKY